MTNLLSALLILAATPLVYAQTRPDFSGHWSMDGKRSQSAVQNEPVGALDVVIRQTATEMEMVISNDGKTGTVTYRLDGSPSPIPNGTATSHWEGDALVTETVRTIQGQTVTTKETRRLDTGRDEMLVDRILIVQHGYTLAGTKNYGAGSDVFVRAR
jgi:hypothetical protein